MIFGGIVAAAKAAVSVVSSAFTPVIKEVVEIGIEVLKLTVDIIEGLAKKLGLIEEEEETEDLGDRALQAEEAGHKPEDFANYDQYLYFIRDFELDPEKSDELSEEEKLAKGLEVITSRIEDKLDTKMDELVIEVAKNPEFYNEDRLEKYVTKFKEEGLSLNEIASDDSEIDDIKFEVEKELNPELNDMEIYDLINQRD